MDEVAAEGNVGKGTLYLYFKDKEDLFFQLAISGFSIIESAWEEISELSLSSDVKLIKMGEKMSETLETRESLFRLLHSQELMGRKPDLKQVFREHIMRLQKIVKKVLSEGIADGLFRDDIDLEIVDCMFFGCMHARFRRKIHQGQAVPVSSIVSLLIRGIGAQ